jgi:iron complex transport system substrate-binding protein
MKIRTVSIAIVLVSLAASCRGSGETTAPTDGGTTATTTSSPTEQPAVYPREVTHLGGSFTLDEQPQNIITLGFSPTDVVVGLGVIPVGAFVNSEKDPFGTHVPLTAYEDQIPSIGVFEINLEVIAAARPDLIVALSWIEGFKGYDEMQKIAPVMVMDPEDHWSVWLEDVAYAMGLEAEAEELLAAYEARAAEVGEIIPDGTEVALVAPEDGGAATIYGPDSAPGYLALDAGLDVLTITDGAIDWDGEEGGAVVWTELSKERIEEVTSPTMIVLTFLDGQFEAVEDDPLWTGLPAFQDDAVYVETGGEAWFQPGPLGAMYALDQIESFYAAA